jgi:hypothetical protein
LGVFTTAGSSFVQQPLSATAEFGLMGLIAS